MGILTDEMKRVVTELQLCYAATVTPDGKPNLSPKVRSPSSATTNWVSPISRHPAPLRTSGTTPLSNSTSSTRLPVGVFDLRAAPRS